MLDEIGKPLAWSGVLPDHTGFQRMIPIAVVLEGEESAPPEYRLVRRQEGKLMQCR
jgi:hypothetical protein